MPAGRPRPGLPLRRLTSHLREIAIVRRIGITTAAVLAAVLGALALTVLPVHAADPGPPTLSGVIDSLRLWLVGLLAGMATLFLTIGGLRYMAAGGDPAQVEKAKTALRSALIGYALAALSPVIVGILRSIVGA